MPKAQTLPSFELLQNWFRYDPEIGLLFWKQRPAKNIKLGAMAGKPQKPLGYVQIGFQGKTYLAHRLIWKLNYNEEPPTIIDHIDGDRANNRIDNLRTASNAENMSNRSKTVRNKTGFKGVCFNKKLNKYQANICKDYKLYHLGVFKTAEEAHAAYCQAAEKLHGPFQKG